MGRFATTVALYEELRPPYSAEFFHAAAQRLSLGKQHSLIDLGTGPGLLALGFAPYGGRIVGVDPEPAMIAAARKAALRASQPLTLIESRAEDLPAGIGSFDVVTIGRALHWMDRDATLGCLSGSSHPRARSSSVRPIPPPMNATRGSANSTRRGDSGRRPACGRSQAAASAPIATLRLFSAARGFTSRTPSRSRPTTRSACTIWRAAC
jgi:SAM-dependent methyltransferase